MRINNQQLIEWEKFLKDLERATPVINDETPEEKRKRVDGLMADWQKALRYYFPNYCTKPFTAWQKRYAKRLLGKGKRYIVRQVFRGGSKTTFTQMMVVYMILAKRIRNLLWVSKSLEAAMEMTRVLRLQLEGNQRLINDFGEQKAIGAWGDEKFVTRSGVSVRAIGKGQSPRGAKEEEARPDCIILDDVDDDEEVRNETRLNNTWDWTMGALFGCFAVDGDNLFIGLGNKIAEDCIIERMRQIADDFEQVNLLNAAGRPTCPEWFTIEDCNYMIGKMGTRLAQREYFNNPIVEGRVFKTDWLQYKKLPRLSEYKYLVAYLDPSFKNKKTSDHKSLVLVGLMRGEYHIHKAYCAKASVNEMIAWHYDLDQYLRRHNAAAQYWMEEVFLQDLLYDDFNKAEDTYGYRIPVRGDTRKKPDKDARISACSGDFERGNVYFNEDEKDNHHMQELWMQFSLFAPGETRIAKDGPDSFEGAREILKQMVFTSEPPTYGKRQLSSKYRY